MTIIRRTFSYARARQMFGPSQTINGPVYIQSPVFQFPAPRYGWMVRGVRDARIKSFYYSFQKSWQIAVKIVATFFVSAARRFHLTVAAIATATMKAVRIVHSANLTNFPISAAAFPTDFWLFIPFRVQLFPCLNIERVRRWSGGSRTRWIFIASYLPLATNNYVRAHDEFNIYASSTPNVNRHEKNTEMKHENIYTDEKLGHLTEKRGALWCRCRV